MSDKKKRPPAPSGEGADYNADAKGLQGSEPKRSVRVKPLGQSESKEGVRAEYSIGIRSSRVNLLDPDNYYVKDIVDQLRYARLIPEDDPQTVEIEITPQKVTGYKKEETIIEIRRNAG